MPELIILGRQPELSLAELEAVVGADHLSPFGRTAALVTEPVNLPHLGGSLKAGPVIAQGQRIESLFDELFKQLPPQGRLTIGLSLYGHKAKPFEVGMNLKKRLKAAGRSVRLVLPKPGQSALSAAQIKFNGLATLKQPEVILAQAGQELVLALTNQYQDIDAYSARDYERPARSGRVGMLPPKLAQILINLSRLKSGTIIDPFCGSGVILQEARLMGFSAIGYDLDPAMVAAATANLVWLNDQVPNLPHWEVQQADARSVQIKATQAAIVSENYLGPPFTQSPTPTQVKLANLEVSEITASFLKQIHPQIESNTPIVLCLPVWQTKTGPVSASVVDEINRLGYTLDQFAHIDSSRLLYHRPGQIVGRRILVMRPS